MSVKTPSLGNQTELAGFTIFMVNNVFWEFLTLKMGIIPASWGLEN